MRRTTNILILIMTTTLVACAGEPLDEASANKASRNENSAEGAPDDLPTLAGADEDHPCGESTVEVVHKDGVRVDFCVLADGLFAVGEHHRGDTAVPSLLATVGYSPTSMCPADLLRAIAPDRPVPERLEAACDPSRLIETLHPPSGLVPKRLGGEPNPSTWDYCGSSGASNWDNEWNEFYIDHWLYYIGHHTEYDAVVWAIDDPWGWHDRWMTGTSGLSDEANIGQETVASCNGTTRFQAWWRWDAGDAWTVGLDADVGHGGYYWWNISYQEGFEDIDVRFRADSDPGAFHRHAGIFVDE